MHFRTARGVVACLVVTLAVGLAGAGGGSAASLKKQPPFCGTTAATKPAVSAFKKFLAHHYTNAQLRKEETSLEKRYSCQFGG